MRQVRDSNLEFAGIQDQMQGDSHVTRRQGNIVFLFYQMTPDNIPFSDHFRLPKNQIMTLVFHRDQIGFTSWLHDCDLNRPYDLISILSSQLITCGSAFSCKIPHDMATSCTAVAKICCLSNFPILLLSTSYYPISALKCR